MTLPAQPPMFYFLIEESARELASRVLLGVIAAEQGMTSCIVPQWLVWRRFEALPPGVVLFKGCNKIQTEHMFAARRAGHRVAAIEEEALGLSLASELERQFDPRIADACDLLLAQGEHLREILLAKHPRLTDRIATTGNPRADLLRPPFSDQIKAAGQQLRDTHGKYVLINTNIGAINPRVEDTYAFFQMCRTVGIIDPDNPEDWSEFLGRCEWERGNLDLLTKVIGAYLAHPGAPKLVIRPHPAEDVSKWREAYRDVPGVSIVQEGDHAPWTAGAALMLHTGCTTGLEAALLETPVLCLEGGGSTWHQVHTSNHVNPTAPDVERAMALIIRALAQQSDLPDLAAHQRQAIERHILPWPEDLATNRVVGAIQGLANTLDAGAGSAAIPAVFEDQDFQTSEDKIDPGAFNTEAITKTAEGFASDLKLNAPPIVTSLGTGIITLSPGGKSARPNQVT
jgi:surface carbohydrate biosynthesis protein